MHPVRLLAFSLAAVLAPQLSAAQELPPTTRPSVRLIVSSRDDAGTNRATSSLTFDHDFTTSFHTGPSGCDLRQASNLPPDALIGWTIKAHIARSSSSEMVVEFESQRVGINPAPAARTELTLHAGDQLPIDRVSFQGSGPCGPTTIAIHAGFLSAGDRLESQAAVNARRLASAGGAGGGFGGTARGGTVGSGAGGGRAGGGGGRAGSSASSEAGRAATAGGGASFGVGRAGGGGFSAGRGIPQENFATMQQSLKDGLDTATLQRSTVTVWLVHHHRDGSETSSSLVVTTGPDAGEFRFPALTLAGDGNTGPRYVHVSGLIQHQKFPDGRERLFVGVVRGIARESTGNWESLGYSKQSVAPPSAQDVIAFAMPGVAGRGFGDRGAATGETGGDTFSLRLRMTR